MQDNKDLIKDNPLEENLDVENTTLLEKHNEVDNCNVDVAKDNLEPCSTLQCEEKAIEDMILESGIKPRKTRTRKSYNLQLILEFFILIAFVAVFIAMIPLEFRYNNGRVGMIIFVIIGTLIFIGFGIYYINRTFKHKKIHLLGKLSIGEFKQSSFSDQTIHFWFITHDGEVRESMEYFSQVRWHTISNYLKFVKYFPVKYFGSHAKIWICQKDLIKQINQAKRNINN